MLYQELDRIGYSREPDDPCFVEIVDRRKEPNLIQDNQFGVFSGGARLSLLLNFSSRRVSSENEKEIIETNSDLT